MVIEGDSNINYDFTEKKYETYDKLLGWDTLQGNGSLVLNVKYG